MIEWHVKTPEELERLLKTDLERGLSDDTAQLRTTEKKNTLFAKKQKNKMHYAKQMLIVLLPLLVLVTAVAALMSGERELGYTLLFSSLFCMLCLFLAYSRARYLIEIAEETAESSSRVLRGGVYTILPHGALAEGDLVYLEKGDFVPADCRLIRAASLVVRESGITSKTRCEKNAAISSCGDIYDAANMVWAGTVVEDGVGIAVVCHVGDETHFRKTLEVAKASGFEETPFFKRVKKLSSIMTALFFGLLFLTAVLGFFSLTRGDFFEGWMLISVFAASAMADFYGVFAYIAAGHALYGIQSGKKKMKEGILLKRSNTIDTLAAIDRVFVSTDWFVTPSLTKTAYLCEPFGRGESFSKTLSPYAQYILRDAAFAIGEVQNAPLSKQGGESEDEALLRASLGENVSQNHELAKLMDEYSLVLAGKTPKGISYGVILRENRFVVTLLAELSLLVPLCRFAYRDGKLMELDGQKRERIFDTERHLLADCQDGVRSCYAVCVSFLDKIPDNGKLSDDLIENKLAKRLAIEGIVTLETPLHQPSVAALTGAFGKELGVLLFCENEKDRRIAARLGFEEKKPMPFQRGESGAIYSATLAEKLALLRYSQKIGEVAAYAGKDFDELPHMKEANLPIKLSAWQFADEKAAVGQGSKRERAHTERLEKCGCDAFRYSADLLVSHPETIVKPDRSVVGRGGFYSLCEGIRHAGGYLGNMRAVFAYLAFSTAVKLIPTLLSLFLQQPILSTADLALLGLVLDPMVALSLALSPPLAYSKRERFAEGLLKHTVCRTALAGFLGGGMIAAFSFLLPAEKEVTLDFVTAALFMLSLTAFPLQSALLKRPFSRLGIGTLLVGFAVFVFSFFSQEEFHLMSILYLVLLWVLFLAVELAALTLKKEKM